MTSEIVIIYLRTNNILIKTFYRSSRLLMVSLMKTWLKTFIVRYNTLKQNSSTDSNLWWRTSIAWCIHFLLTLISQMRKKRIYVSPRWTIYQQFKRKLNGLWIGLRKHLSKKDWLRLLRLKVSSSQVHSAQSFGWNQEVSCKVCVMRIL